MELTEAEDMKRRWQEYSEALYKKDINDLDNYDDVITHLASHTQTSYSENSSGL